METATKLLKQGSVWGDSSRAATLLQGAINLLQDGPPLTIAEGAEGVRHVLCEKAAHELKEIFRLANQLGETAGRLIVTMEEAGSDAELKIVSSSPTKVPHGPNGEECEGLDMKLSDGRSIRIVAQDYTATQLWAKNIAGEFPPHIVEELVDLTFALAEPK